MAVTKIWPVRGRVDAVIDYAANPQKTSKESLRNVIEYAVNTDKTDKQLFVSGINCDTTNIKEEFNIVKRQFGKTGGIVAYHGYQSFAKGEVTPEIAHRIGIEFAEKVWGEEFQVIVTTHLNTGCIHNHFVINSVSFSNGKRLRRKQWTDIYKISDEICCKHKVSVIDKKNGKAIPYVIAKAEAEGKPSRLNIAKEVVDYYIKESCNLRELEINLRKQGYICQFDYNRKYWTIRQKDWKRPIRLIQMGEEYSNECIRARVAEPKAHNKTEMRSFRKADVCYKVKKVKTKKVKGLKGLYFYYCYRLGCFPQKKQNSRYIHYIYRDDLLKLKNITDEAHLLCTQGIEDKKQLDAYKKRLESNIEALCEERKQLNNVIRRSTVSENKKSVAMDRKSEITKELKALRRQIYLCDGISRRSDIIREKISVEKAKVKEKEYTR